jgi:hypothetical protein
VRRAPEARTPRNTNPHGHVSGPRHGHAVRMPNEPTTNPHLHVDRMWRRPPARGPRPAARSLRRAAVRSGQLGPVGCRCRVSVAWTDPIADTLARVRVSVVASHTVARRTRSSVGRGASSNRVADPHFPRHVRFQHNKRIRTGQHEIFGTAYATRAARIA